MVCGWVLVCCLWFSVEGWFVLVGVDLCVWPFIHSASVDWLGGWWAFAVFGFAYCGWVGCSWFACLYFWNSVAGCVWRLLLISFCLLFGCLFVMLLVDLCLFCVDGCGLGVSWLFTC